MLLATLLDDTTRLSGGIVSFLSIYLFVNDYLFFPCSESFQNARRSTIRKMGPMKFAKLNGLSVSSLSMPPAKGDPDERVSK